MELSNLQLLRTTEHKKRIDHFLIYIKIIHYLFSSMNSYSEEYLNSLYQDEEFLTEYNEFIKENVQINQFKKFIDEIELNRKYFRLTLHKVGKNRRYKNQNLGEDTIAIKEINSLLNKLNSIVFII